MTTTMNYEEIDRIHSDLVREMTNLILEKGRHYEDDPIPNCWEAGMMKSITMINQYFRDLENGKIKWDN